MLTGIGSDDRVRRVKSVWRGDPDRFDVWIGAELVDAVIGLRAIALAECFEHARVDVSRGDQCKFGHLFHRRQDF